MCEPEETKSNNDLSSDSSWSVLEESGGSKNSSLENILGHVISEDKTQLDQLDNNIESTFINIPNTNIENFENVSEENQHKTGEVNKSKVHKFKSKKHKPGKSKTETLSLLAIAASILTITTLTMMTMLFPQDFEIKYDPTPSSNHLHMKTEKTKINTYPELNHSSFNYSKHNRWDFFIDANDNNRSEEFSTDDGICSLQENEPNDDISSLINSIKPSMDDYPPDLDQFEDIPTFNIDTETIRNTTNKFVKGLKKAFSNGSLHVLVCAFMQDLCLIKLMRQINKQNEPMSNEDKRTIKKKKPLIVTNKKKPISQSPKMVEKKLINKLNDIIKKKLKELEMLETNRTSNKKSESTELSISTPIVTNYSDSQIIQKLNKRYNNDTEVKNREKDNGKSECQRRFEELDYEWEAIGQNHRQKIQEIKEKFKNEIHLIKENESEDSARRHRIKLIREKYLQRLKNDREKYLLQLKRLRDERHRILSDVCHQKKYILDFRDAAVGNYAILLPETYDFQQKLKTLRQKENENQVNSSYEIKNMNTTSSDKTTFSSVHKMKRNDSDDVIWQEKLKQMKYQKYSKPYELARKALKKRRRKVKTNKTKTSMTPVIQEMVSNMISSISDSISTIEKDGKNSETDNVNNENTSDNPTEKLDPLNNNNITFPMKFFVNDKIEPKRDIYEVAFGENATRIKEVESLKWSLERRSPKQPMQLQFLSKQDPKKSHKDKIIFKGPL